VRVTHVMASGERGGGADHLVGLLPELVRLGIDCRAVVSPEGPLAARLETLGLEVHRVEMMRSRLDVAAVRRLRHELAEQSPDVVHAHGTRGAFFVALGRPLAPLVYTAHGLAYRQSVAAWRRGILLGAEAVACRAAALVVSVSAADLDDLRRRRLVGPAAGVHIPNAVDTNRFALGDRTEARLRLDLPADAFIVGTVARLVPQKSVQDLVEAALACPEVTLVIVGDGPLRRELEDRARAARERIRFFGARDDVPDILRALDVFALSSRWEGEPIALLEAMATGLPCVATAIAGVREVLGDGQLGMLVEVGSPQAMARAMRLLRADPDLRRRLGEVGRSKMESRSWAAVATQLVDVYAAVSPTAR
jgi:glycosyltransferase involved in cell wall biosynthesis